MLFNCEIIFFLIQWGYIVGNDIIFEKWLYVLGEMLLMQAFII